VHGTENRRGRETSSTRSDLQYIGFVFTQFIHVFASVLDGEGERGLSRDRAFELAHRDSGLMRKLAKKVTSAMATIFRRFANAHSRIVP